jgi:CxxC motif-containing protein
VSRRTQPIQCIGCPVGCGGEVVVEGDRVVEMRGFTCDKGQAYAAEEVVAPKRMVTTTVRISGGSLAYLPVVSERAVPKESIFDCVRLLRGVEVKAPVEADQVIVADALGLGVAFRAARSIPAAVPDPHVP